MKDVPEIAPEIRGLLEEIVANPRSAIRLAPRRALRSWFDSGETVRATDVSRERAARHLVEAHREALAALLREASWISFWKAPGLSFRPIGEDGSLYHPTQREPEWRRRAGREAAASTDHSSGVELLRRCLEGIEPQQGWAFAQAALSLVPNDKTRFDLALNAEWRKPRTAITLFRRLIVRSPPTSLRTAILLCLGAQTCHLGLLGDAHRFYRASSALDPESPHGWSSAFNLSCLLGDSEQAREEATELGTHVGPEDLRILEQRDLLRTWRATRSKSELNTARGVIRQIGDRIPEVARTLCEGFEP